MKLTEFGNYTSCLRQLRVNELDAIKRYKKTKKTAENLSIIMFVFLAIIGLTLGTTLSPYSYLYFSNVRPGLIIFISLAVTLIVWEIFFTKKSLRKMFDVNDEVENIISRDHLAESLTNKLERTFLRTIFDAALKQWRLNNNIGIELQDCRFSKVFTTMVATFKGYCIVPERTWKITFPGIEYENNGQIYVVSEMSIDSPNACFDSNYKGDAAQVTVEIVVARKDKEGVAQTLKNKIYEEIVKLEELT